MKVGDLVFKKIAAETSERWRGRNWMKRQQIKPVT